MELMQTSLPYMYTYLQELAGNSIEDVYTESSLHQPQQLYPPGYSSNAISNHQAWKSLEEASLYQKAGGIGSSEPRVRSISHRDGKFARCTAVAYVFRHKNESRCWPIGLSYRKESICFL